MPILGIIASQDYTRITSSYESIASATGTGASGTITFSSIPATYSHLQIRCNARTDAGFSSDFIQFRINSDSGANYTYHGLEGDGSAASAFAGTGETVALGTTITGASASANIMGSAIIDFIDYATTTKYKTVRHFGGTDRNGTGATRLESNLWLNTSAISTITITSFRSFVETPSSCVVVASV